MGDKIEHKAEHSDSIGSDGSRGKFDAKISKRTHNVFVNDGVALRFVFIGLDALFSLRGNVVFEKVLSDRLSKGGHWGGEDLCCNV